MTATIIDEFTALNVSRERKRQLRRRAAGYCARAGCRARKGRGAFCVVCAGVESKRVAKAAKRRRRERREREQGQGTMATTTTATLTVLNDDVPEE